MCREPMLLLARDDDVPLARVVVVDWTAATAHAGVTLQSSPRQPGGKEAVLVSKINQSDAAYAAGLRRGDVVLEMNDLPCVSHEWAARALDVAARHGAPVQCTIAPLRRKVVLLPSIVSMTPREWRRGGMVRLASTTEAGAPLVGAVRGSAQRWSLL